VRGGHDFGDRNDGTEMMAPLLGGRPNSGRRSSAMENTPARTQKREKKGGQAPCVGSDLDFESDPSSFEKTRGKNWKSSLITRPPGCGLPHFSVANDVA